MGLFSSIGSALGTAANVISGGFSGFQSGGWLGAVGGAVSGLGAGISGATSAQSMREGIESQNRENRREAALNREFQVRSYKNRYEWQRHDLIQAGLNPILAYQQGAGSSLSGGQARYENVEQGTPEAINSAYKNFETSVRTKGAIQHLAQQKEAIARTKEEVERTKYQTTLTNQQRYESQQREFVEKQREKNLKTENEILDENLNSAKAAGARAQVEEEFWKTKEGGALIKADLVGRSINPMASSAKSIKGLVK